MSHVLHVRSTPRVSAAPRRAVESLPSQAPGLSRRDRLELEKFEKATGMDKSLSEYFDGLKNLPKGPVRHRRAA